MYVDEEAIVEQNRAGKGESDNENENKMWAQKCIGRIEEVGGQKATDCKAENLRSKLAQKSEGKRLHIMNA